MYYKTTNGNFLDSRSMSYLHGKTRLPISKVYPTEEAWWENEIGSDSLPELPVKTGRVSTEWSERQQIAIKNSKNCSPAIRQADNFKIVLSDGTVFGLLYKTRAETRRRVHQGTNTWTLFTIEPEEKLPYITPIGVSIRVESIADSEPERAIEYAAYPVLGRTGGVNFGFKLVAYTTYESYLGNRIEKPIHELAYTLDAYEDILPPAQTFDWFTGQLTSPYYGQQEESTLSVLEVFWKEEAAQLYGRGSLVPRKRLSKDEDQIPPIADLEEEA